jgi:hypothetical protein
VNQHPALIDLAFAKEFANEWIAAWNAHDLDRILTHYADDFKMSSPFIVTIAGEPGGTLRGKTAVAAYWRKAFALVPDLKFELLEVFAAPRSVCVLYNSIRGFRVVEWFYFGADGKVIEAAGHYNAPV